MTLMTTLVAIPLVAAAGIAVDYGRATRAHQALQIIADTATLAAASAKSVSGSSSSQATTRTQIATSYVTAEMKGVSDVWVTKQPTVSVTSNSITVTVPGKVKGSLTNVLSMLPKSALLGGGTTTSTTTGDYMDIDVTAKSTANWTTGPQYLCFLVLNGSKTKAMSIQGTADIKATNCAVYVNSSDATALYENGNATLTASNINVVGDYSGSAYYPLPNIHQPVFADPLASTYATDYAATYSTAPTQSYGCSASGTCTLSPGVYQGGISVQGGKTISLSPGTYWIKDGTLQVKNGSTISGTGVTIILVGTNSNLDIQAGGNLILSAPSSGRFAGLALVQDKNVVFSNPNKTKNAVIGGGSLSITGIIYFPTHDFYVTGNGTSVTNLSTTNPQFAIVADTVTIQGNGQVNVGGNSDFNAAGLPALPSSGTTKAVISLR